MALWAIGDFHLNFSTDKPMKVFDSVWKNHEKKIEKSFRKMVKLDDTVVITGEHSWGCNLEECAKDLEFIEAFPDRKINTDDRRTLKQIALGFLHELPLLLDNSNIEVMNDKRS